MATTAKERKKLDRQAKGKFWAVLPPEEGHPQADLSWRLYRNIPPYGWMHILFGHENTVKELAEMANRADDRFFERQKLLREHNIPSLQHKDSNGSANR